MPGEYCTDEGTVKERGTAAFEIRSKADKLDGSIQYAIENIQNGYGSYEEVDASESEIIASLESGQTLLARLEAEAKACDEEYRTYEKRQRYMTDLYKDVKRIVTTHESVWKMRHRC